MWLLTQVRGAPAVRNVVLAAIEVPDSCTNVSHATTMPGVGEYCCRAAAYGPFLVRVDYGWVSGPMRGDGGSVLYSWLLGPIFRVYEFRHWMV